jgi:hypothetical protein
MRTLLALLIAMFMQANAMADDAVLIDKSQAAYWVVYRFAGAEAEAIRARIAAEPKIAMVAWSAFKVDPQAHAGAVISKDEYPGSNLLPGIVALLEKYPKTPFGITWTGGLAFTRNDYRHAERIYDLYRERPEAYERSKVSGERSRDPVFPANHLDALLAR